MWLFDLINKIYELADMAKALDQDALAQAVCGALIATALIYMLIYIASDIIGSCAEHPGEIK